MRRRSRFVGRPLDASRMAAFALLSFSRCRRSSLEVRSSISPCTSFGPTRPAGSETTMNDLQIGASRTAIRSPALTSCAGFGPRSFNLTRPLRHASVAFALVLNSLAHQRNLSMRIATRERRCSRRSSVTPEGFEPPTNGTGIRHSIQLNYGARPAAKIAAGPHRLCCARIRCARSPMVPAAARSRWTCSREKP